MAMIWKFRLFKWQSGRPLVSHLVLNTFLDVRIVARQLLTEPPQQCLRVFAEIASQGRRIVPEQQLRYRNTSSLLVRIGHARLAVFGKAAHFHAGYLYPTSIFVTRGSK